MRYVAPQLLTKVEPSEAGQSSWAPGVADAAGAADEEAAAADAGSEPSLPVGVQAHW